MTSISFGAAFLYLLLSLVFYLLFNRDNKWKALLLSGIISIYLISPATLALLIVLGLITFYGGKKIAKNPDWFEYIIPIFLIILVLYKLITPVLDKFGMANAGIVAENSFVRVLFNIIGISYFTFNAIAYLFDVKRKFTSPVSSYPRLLLYLFYFPALFSGPLHKPNYLIAKFSQVQISNENLANGCRLMLWGTFKNLVVAERIRHIMVVLEQNDISGIYLLVTGLLFILYLYCNFSSFIDFFRGVSEVFGIRMKENFRNRVYFSYCRHDYWRGWHITLNEWFRDYFFYPQMKKKWIKSYQWLLLVTFMLIGLWHDLSLKMLIWGTLNGLWIIAEKESGLPEKFNTRWKKTAGIIYHLTVSSFLACLFIFPSLEILFERFTSAPHFPIEIVLSVLPNLLLTAFAFIVMDQVNRLADNKSFDLFIQDKNPFLRRVTYACLIGMLFFLGNLTEGIDNFYVQF